MYQFRSKFKSLALATAFLSAGQVFAGQLGVLDENVIVITPQPLPEINTPVVETPIVSTPVINTPTVSTPSVSVPTAQTPVAPVFVPGGGNAARNMGAGMSDPVGFLLNAAKEPEMSRGYSAMASMLAGQRLNQASLSQGLKGLSKKGTATSTKISRATSKKSAFTRARSVVITGVNIPNSTTVSDDC